MSDSTWTEERITFGRNPKMYEQWGAPQRKVSARLIELFWDEWAKKGEKDTGDDVVLDLGAGTGFAEDALRARAIVSAKLPPPIVAADLSFAMLAHAKSKHGPHHVAADAQRLPFRDEVFSGIVSSFLLHWIEDRALALGEMQRCLRPGGSLWIAVPVAGSFSEFYQLIADEVDPRGTLYTPYPFPESEEVELGAGLAGFSKVDRFGIEPFGFHPLNGIEALRFMRYAGAGATIGALAMHHAPSFPVRLVKRWRPTPLMFRMLFFRAVK